VTVSPSLFSSGRFQHTNLFHGDQRPARDHLVEDGEKPIDVGLIVHDLDQHGEISRQLDEARGVNHTTRAEPGDAMDNGCAREAFCPQPLQDRS
jgi:hypothetical protein